MDTQKEGVLPCGRPRPVKMHKKNAHTPEQMKAQLVEYLNQEGLKYSEQRLKIAEVVLGSGGHLSAQELIDRMRTEHPEIGPATVYRNLKLLCDANIIKETLIDAQGRTIYEIADEEHHDHIVCLQCDEIFEFHNEEIEKKQKDIATGLNFKEMKHRHVIYAQCEWSRKNDR